MMAREMLVGLIMGFLLAIMLVPKTMQLPMNHHPLHNVERRINGKNLRLGLILSSASDEKVLLESGLFVLNDDGVFRTTGRTFYFGSLKGAPVVYAVALSPLASVSLTVELMVYWINVNAIIDYGNAATVSDSVKLGDVAVISEAAYTSAWTWKERGSNIEATKELPSLKFGDYNEPKSGDNKLGSIEYNKVIRYKPGDRDHSTEETFWHSADPEFFEIASKLKDMNVLGRSCIGKMCTNASIVHGVKASTSDAYVQNFAYGQFLHKTLNVSTIDMKSVATISTTSLNNVYNETVNHIIFRAASNKPGEKKDPKISALARENNLKVVIAFIELLRSVDNQVRLPTMYCD